MRDASSPATSSSPVTDILSTNAVTRNLSDLHAPTWFALLTANIGARTMLFHPIQLAISRKRLTRESTPPTLLGLLQASYHGGCTSAYGGASPVGKYNFGQGGIRGCYRGVGAALLCNLVGETSYLFTLEAIKEYAAHAVDVPSSKWITGSAANAVTSTTPSLAPTAPPTDAHIFVASSYSTALGAMCGDLVALLLVTPLVIVCNRQMTAGYSMASTNRYSSVPRTLREVWALHQRHTTTTATPRWTRVERLRRGVSGLYQGLSAGLLRLPSSGCWWGLYTKSKEVLYTVSAPTLHEWEHQSRENTAHQEEKVSSPLGAASRSSVWKRNWLLSSTDNPLLNAAAGIIASVVTTFLFNPIAVIQTRQQALPPRFWAEQAGAAAASSSPGAFESIVPRHKRTWRSSLPFQRVYYVAADLIQKEGLRGFFKGTPANMSVSILDGIVFTLLFELTKLGSDVQFLENIYTE